jgi:hypothetical protein
MRYRTRQTAALVFFIALTTRLFGVVLTTVTDLNTYAQADVNRFSAAAEFIADGLRRGTFITNPEFSNTINTWGSALAPFWLLPGPSRIYARIGVALLGAFAVYNVYIIARSYASRQAALVAVVPLIFYPSFIFIHSTILREAAVLVGLTTSARFLIVPSPRLSLQTNYGLAVLFLWFSLVFRPENLTLIVAVLALAIAVKYRHVIADSVVRHSVPPIAIVGTILAYPQAKEIVRSLAKIRRKRARGRTEYLGHVFPESVMSAIAFSWIGAVYFLFTPFPWMVEDITGFIALFEGLGNLVFAMFGVIGARKLRTRNSTVSVALTAGVVLGAVLYGLGTANVGTAIRHRQMLLWAVFLLGGLGIAEKFQFTVGIRSTTNSDIITHSEPQ